MRKICIVTGTRAEFGLLQPLMHQIQASSKLELQIIATGAHLSSYHGDTLKEIEGQGFQVDEKVPMLLASDAPEAVGQSLGLGVIGLTSALSRLQPDLVVLLGDRYEALAAAQSAMILQRPIAHIHGGEKTEGAFDEAIRHSISKMSHLHFVAAEPFQDRVVQLGESPDRVHVVGAVGLDNIEKLTPMSRSALEADLDLALNDPVFLVTYHPVTLETFEDNDATSLLAALEHFTQATVVFTGANADPLASKIDQQIEAFCGKNRDRTLRVTSLGSRRYLSLMAHADVVVGNSSSGLLEAPYMGVPTVNIGPRQSGRPQAPSVIDCENTEGSIVHSIEKALSHDQKAIASQRQSPYGSPGAAKRIVDVLETASLDGLLAKSFYDLN